MFDIIATFHGVSVLGRLEAVAVGGDAVVNSAQVGKGMVVTGHDMIDGVSVRASTDVADELIPPQYDLPTGTPVFWKSSRPSASLPMDLMF